MEFGFIGLGAQGKPLALNIVQAGFPLTVFDIRSDPVSELLAAGAKSAGSPQELAAQADIVAICVLDDAQLKQVMLEDDGVLQGARSGAIVVVHSTVNPTTIDTIARTALKSGVEVLDAPVSGGDAGARNKSMSYMVGGDEAALDKCRPMFEASGTKITHTGELGSGIRAKLAHQLIICVNILAAAEGMELGVKAGLAPELLQKVVSEGAAQSRMADHWSQLKLGKHSEQVFYKDLQVCLQFARDLGISVPGAALAQQMLSKIVP